MEELAELKSILLQPLALLQILQHCEDSEALAAGHLVGLDLGSEAEVTGTFALPVKQLGETSMSLESFNAKTLEIYKRNDFDNQLLGWYKRTLPGETADFESIEYLYELTAEFPQAFMLVYDPMKAAVASFPLKAYKLSEAFMVFFEESDYTLKRALELKLKASQVLVEVPLRVETDLLTEALLAEYGVDIVSSSVADEAFRGFMEKHVSEMTNCLEQLHFSQQQNLQYIKSAQRQRAQQKQFEAKRVEENKQREARGEPLLNIYEGSGSLYRAVTPPNHLEVLLTGQQADVLAKDLDEYCGLAARTMELVASSDTAAS